MKYLYTQRRTRTRHTQSIYKRTIPQQRGNPLSRAENSLLSVIPDAKKPAQPMTVRAYRL